jgi:hypothetical protein
MRPILFAAAMLSAMSAATAAVARVSVCPLANADASAGPGTRLPIPLPDQALLAPPPQFDCVFKAARPDDVGGEPPSKPPSAQGDPGTDAALRRQLDYERQCYRHAEMILRDRLLLLQGPAGDTIKAAAKCGPASASARIGANPAVPLPDQALLAPPPEFSCELKAEAGSDARKLDYERQCYRHAEMILRDRLLQLQASLGETITAISRSSDVAAEGSWGQYRDKELGLTFDLPAHIFSLDSAKRGRPGTLFSSPDGRAQVRVFGSVNKTNDTPRQYLRRTAGTDQANFTYVRTTSTFFVASGTRDGMIFYRRCNFSSSAAKRIGCIQLDYPQREKRAWDAAVTRMSRSLRIVALD